MKGNLNQYTEAELLAELERRKKPTRPNYKVFVSSQDLVPLINACEGYLDNIDNDDGDDKQWVFEAAMELLYGNGVWVYVNAR